MSSTTAGRIAAALLPLLAAAAGEARAQSLAERVAAAPDGAVRFSYPARPGACGDGDAIMVRGERRGGDSIRMIRGSRRGMRGEWENCAAGPVHVELRREARRVEDVRLRVGDGFSGRASDLGEVVPQAAADFLLELAARLPSDPGEEAIFGAVLARGVSVHPRLLRLAESDAVPTDTRGSAVFWAGQEGASLDELRRLYARVPVPVQEQVVFAYSQSEDPAAARELLRLARSEGEPRDLRDKAVFWLGQAAGRAVAGDLDELAGDEGVEMRVREQAVFALSQRPAEEAVPALIRIARTGSHPRLRERAIFWLGQSGDPRALALFAELLGIR